MEDSIRIRGRQLVAAAQAVAGSPRSRPFLMAAAMLLVAAAQPAGTDSDFGRAMDVGGGDKSGETYSRSAIELPPQIRNGADGIRTHNLVVINHVVPPAFNRHEGEQVGPWGIRCRQGPGHKDGNRTRLSPPLGRAHHQFASAPIPRRRNS